MAVPVWVFDTSSLIAVKAAVPRANHERVFSELTRLVRRRRLVFPREVLGELRRERRDRRKPRAIDWAVGVEAIACRTVASFADARAVLARIPEIIDPTAESPTEEADPWVLALAFALHRGGRDARVITEDTRDIPPRVSLHTGCAVFGIPTLPLYEFLRSVAPEALAASPPKGAGR